MFKYAICCFGILLLSHASYSALQQIRIQRNQENGNQSLPFDIIAECLASIVIMLIGLTVSTKKFENISLEETNKKNKMDTINTHSDFHVLRNRGRVFASSN
ncbi:hypothetical protein H8356DRAFT_1673573 [Neocallimastix lanati (nom. inval.)]|uniref:Membrane magnesium transporter n=1 Tax=Neocallimastix californiae TaxID=1754190 RepID=A0A1Y2CN40_9FUNG|nr:hypothetical protein H8356DRAFT_1673573 [Neocallimastix sp. JGI-2020a]ORY48377.1 hypothetical protein LY90DRAFT_671050 [Neocallimastix californiae]|eukprot:ORY48377.1 hypothetical protein LY90DRAFT_671050 [Neocallimastix californiae]